MIWQITCWDYTDKHGDAFIIKKDGWFIISRIIVQIKYYVSDMSALARQ